MIALELQPRLIENKDWATVVFILAFALVVKKPIKRANKEISVNFFVIGDDYLVLKLLCLN